MCYLNYLSLTEHTLVRIKFGLMQPVHWAYSLTKKRSATVGVFDQFVKDLIDLNWSANDDNVSCKLTDVWNFRIRSMNPRHIIILSRAGSVSEELVHQLIY